MIFLLFQLSHSLCHRAPHYPPWQVHLFPCPSSDPNISPPKPFPCLCPCLLFPLTATEASLPWCYLLPSPALSQRVQAHERVESAPRVLRFRHPLWTEKCCGPQLLGWEGHAPLPTFPNPACLSHRYFLDSTSETSLVSTAYSVPRPWHSACPRLVSKIHALTHAPWRSPSFGLGAGKRCQAGGVGVELIRTKGHMVDSVPSAKGSECWMLGKSAPALSLSLSLSTRPTTSKGSSSSEVLG